MKGIQTKKKKIVLCPRCGSMQVRELDEEDSKRYDGDTHFCEDCDWPFSHDDVKFEELRHQVSALLMDTNESNPITCDIVIGEDVACGLSSLLLPHIDKCYQAPGEGIMYFHEADTVPAMWYEFDQLSMSDAEAILQGLKELKQQ